MILAICGTEHNTGVTHFSIALSNYLCSKVGKRVAYLEVNATDEISAICPKYQSDQSGFIKHRIHFFPNVTLASLPIILSLPFDHYVLDFGVLNTNTFREFMRADQCFILGYSSPWKISSFSVFLQRFEEFHVLDQAIMLEPCNYNVQSKEISFESGYRRKIFSIPFLENPFQLTALDLAFYKDIISKFLLLPQTQRRLR